MTCIPLGIHFVYMEDIMLKSEMLRARIEPRLKYEVEDIFRKLGLSTSEAINLFYTQVQLRKGLPFQVALPNELTLKTFKYTDKNEDIVNSDNSDEMFDKLGI